MSLSLAGSFVACEKGQTYVASRDGSAGASSDGDAGDALGTEADGGTPDRAPSDDGRAEDGPASDLDQADTSGDGDAPDGDAAGCAAGLVACPGASGCVACCADADCGADAPVCAGHVCAKRTLGSACRAKTECASDACADGVCCNNDCAGACLSCLKIDTGGADGTCSFVKANAAHGDDCPSELEKTCGYNGRCDGAGGCLKWSASTVCDAATCPTKGTTQTAASLCDGQGTCVQGVTKACGTYLCDEATAVCLSTCATTDDCASGYFCEDGNCAKRPNGQACGASSECLSGVCGGRCCAAGTSCTCPQPSALNLLENPGFDTDLSSWQLTPGEGSSGPAMWHAEDDHACPYSGSAELYHFMYDASAIISQCVPVSDATMYNFGGAIFDYNCGNAYCTVQWFNLASCGGTELDDGNIWEFSYTNPDWSTNPTNNFGPLLPPPTSVSAKVSCKAASPFGITDCFAEFDSLYLSPAPTMY